MKLTEAGSVVIPLTRGFEAIIDECDLPIVSAFKWRAKPNGNTLLRKNDEQSSQWLKTIFLHRLIIGAAPSTIVDHIDRNGLNNRRDNLRIVSVSTNNSNCHLRSKHGYRGVSFHADCTTKPWQAQARFERRKYHFGYYSTKEEAARARDIGLFNLSGDLSILNFPEMFAVLNQEGRGDE